MLKNTCLVIDVWEGQLEIDETTLKLNGVAGIGIRLNNMQGGHHLDNNFWNQWKQAVNFVRFPYFVYNPWVNGATNFAWLMNNMPTDAQSVAIDIEVKYLNYPPATYAAEVADFLSRCQAKWKVIVYTAQWFLPYLKVWPTKYDYWWAQYPDTATYFGGVKTWEDLKIKLDNPKLIKPFNAATIPGTLKMWQFTGDALTLPGTIRPIDVNLFYGNEVDLANYFGNAPVPPPPPKISVVVGEVLDMNNVRVPEKLIVNMGVTVDNYSQTFAVTVDQTPPPPPPPPPTPDPQPTPEFPHKYVLLNDVEAGIEAFGGPRPYIRDGHVGPPTVKLEGETAGTYRIPDRWVEYINFLNPGQDAQNYLWKEGSGWQNGITNYVVRTITFAGNVVEVTRIEGNRAYIKTVSTLDAPPILRDKTGKPILDANGKEQFLRIPCTETNKHPLVQMFTIQYILTGGKYDPNSTVRLDYTTDGRNVLIILFAPEGKEMWIDVRNMKRL